MAGVTSLLGKSPGSERNQEHAEGALDDGMTASGVADPAAREFLPKADPILARVIDAHPGFRPRAWMDDLPPLDALDRKSTRLNSSHGSTSYAVFCLNK